MVAELFIPHGRVVFSMVFVPGMVRIFFPKMSEPQFWGGEDREADTDDTGNDHDKNGHLPVVAPRSLIFRQEGHGNQQSDDQNEKECSRNRGVGA